MSQHKVVVFGGGTFNHVACHLALAVPAFGETAKQLHQMFVDDGSLESHLVLTKMADTNSKLITNSDVAACVEEMLKDKLVKVVVMNAAICDFEMDNPGAARLSSSQDYDVKLKGISTKILATIRQTRPDIVVAGFKTTHGATKIEQVAKAFASMHASKLDVVLANDLDTRENILVTSDLKIMTGTRRFMLEQLVDEVAGMYRQAAWLS